SWLELPFERTVGDELQGVIRDPAGVSESVRLLAQHPDRWWAGVGIGSVELQASARESRGEAFVHARQAVDEAKKRRRPIIVRANDPAAALRAETVLLALYDLISRRSPRMQEVVGRRLAGQSAVDVAQDLGISRQAVDERLRRASWDQEDRLAE